VRGAARRPRVRRSRRRQGDNFLTWFSATAAALLGGARLRGRPQTPSWCTSLSPARPAGYTTAASNPGHGAKASRQNRPSRRPAALDSRPPGVLPRPGAAGGAAGSCGAGARPAPRSSASERSDPRRGVQRVTRPPCASHPILVSQGFQEFFRAARILQSGPRLSAHEPLRASVDAGQGSWERPAFRRVAGWLAFPSL
jgi:hypothetical protein